MIKDAVNVNVSIKRKFQNDGGILFICYSQINVGYWLKIFFMSTKNYRSNRVTE